VNSIMESKACTKCGAVHQWTPDNFRVANGRLTGWCLACWKSYQHGKYLERIAQAKQVPPVKVDSKACGRCGVIKPAAEFHASTARPDGLQRYCKTCHQSLAVALYDRDRERILAKAAARYAERRAAGLIRRGETNTAAARRRIKDKLAAVQALIKRGQDDW